MTCVQTLYLHTPTHTDEHAHTHTHTHTHTHIQLGFSENTGRDRAVSSWEQCP